MGEFKAVFQDIKRASKAFEDGSKRFSDIAPKEGPKPPTVTEESLKKALAEVLTAVGVMHDSIGHSMKVHSLKLQRAHDIYVDSDDKSKAAIERLARTLSNPDAIRWAD